MTDRALVADARRALVDAALRDVDGVLRWSEWRAGDVRMTLTIYGRHEAKVVQARRKPCPRLS